MSPRSSSAEADLRAYEVVPPMLVHWQSAANAIDQGYPAISCWQEIEQTATSGGLQLSEEVMQASITENELYDQWVTLGIILTAAPKTKLIMVNSVAATLERLDPRILEVAIPALRVGYDIAVQRDIGDSNLERKKTFRTNLVARLTQLQDVPV